MPGLHIPFRSSSSSSTSRRPPAAPVAVPPASSRHRHLAPTAPSRSNLPAFNTSIKTMLSAAAAQPICPKPVTIPEESISRAHGTSSLNYSSSGSLHLHDPSSMCLAAMVHEFLEEEKEEQKDVSLNSASACGRARCNCIDGVCGADSGEPGGELEDYAASDQQVLFQILEGYTSCTSSVLLTEVSKAVEELTVTDDGGVALNVSSLLGRTVMARLREAGYNAAACKSRWNHGDGLPAGDYEYIDVIMEGKEGKEERMIVDINFKTQFEIARPSSEYAQMLNMVPKVYVGRAERIKQIVKMMSQAAKRSLKAQGLMTPPWRRHKYMQAKWLSPIYRRTTNIEPARQIYKNTQEDDLLVFAGAKGSNLEYASKTLVHSKLEDASKNLAVDSKATAKNLIGIKNEKGSMRENGKEKRVTRGFEAMDLRYKRPLFYEEKCRDICTAMCTSWQLPSLKEKPTKAPLVSALSFALREHRQVSVVF